MNEERPMPYTGSEPKGSLKKAEYLQQSEAGCADAPFCPPTKEEVTEKIKAYWVSERQAMYPQPDGSFANVPCYPQNAGEAKSFAEMTSKMKDRIMDKLAKTEDSGPKFEGEGPCRAHAKDVFERLIEEKQKQIIALRQLLWIAERCKPGDALEEVLWRMAHGERFV